jgi:MerR family transcriptional regulator, light-induced transcriptional regulator
MHHFSIRDVENLSGIKAHTIRIWEQRYGLCACKRKESLHRYYDNEDLKHILRIAYLYHNGYKISKIANLLPEEIIQLASKKIGLNENDVFVNKLMEACLDYNEERFENILHTTLTMMGLEKWIVQIVYPFMDKIGLLWMTDHVLPAQEHFSSSLILKKIIVAIEMLPRITTDYKHRFLLFAPEGEEHEIPLLLAQYLLKKQNFKTILFGRSVSMDALKYYCTHQPVSHLYFHLITNFTNSETTVYLNMLAKQFPDKKIIAAGPLMKNITGQIPHNVEIIHSLKEMMDFAGKK